jgi:hypothetical protein
MPLRRIGRILFRLAAAASLLLCALASAAWVRGVDACDAVARHGPGTLHILYWSRGVVAVEIDRDAPGVTAGRHGPVRWELLTRTPAHLPGWGVTLTPGGRGPVAGFYYGHARRATESVTFASAPLWAVASLTAAPPPAAAASIVRGRRRKRRATAAACPACGYDCRATPGQCPECGRIAPTAAP